MAIRYSHDKEYMKTWFKRGKNGNFYRRYMNRKLRHMMKAALRGEPCPMKLKEWAT